MCEPLRQQIKNGDTLFTTCVLRVQLDARAGSLEDFKSASWRTCVARSAALEARTEGLMELVEGIESTSWHGARLCGVAPTGVASDVARMTMLERLVGERQAAAQQGRVKLDTSSIKRVLHPHLRVA